MEISQLRADLENVKGLDDPEDEKDSDYGVNIGNRQTLHQFNGFPAYQELTRLEPQTVPITTNNARAKIDMLFRTA